VLLLGLPFFLFGIIHNYLQYKTVDVLVQRLVKEVEYFAPVSVLFSLVIYPLTYAGFVTIFTYYIDSTFWWKLVYFLGLPLSGLFAYYYLKYFRHVSLKRNYVFLMRKRRSDIETLKKERESLRRLIFEL
jgi:hypothetical protein